MPYDSMGRVISRTDKEGKKSIFSYYPGGMFKEAVYPDGRSVLLTYDALDHLSRVKDWLGEIVFINDNAGRITQVTDHRGQVLRYGWNPDGSKKWMQYPDGSEVSYEYDDALRLTGVESGEFRLSYRYDDHNRIMECARGNGDKSLYHYNEAGNISELIHLCHGREIEHLSYRYDRFGNPIRIRRQSGEKGYSYLREFAYDRNSRLTEVKEDDRIIRQYRYDGYGNRIGMLCFDKGNTEDIKKIEYSYNPLNQLIQMGERNYVYTLNGELGSSEGQSAPYSYAYDAVGRLNSISSAGRILQQNEYNGLGYRIRTETQPGGMPGVASATDYTVDHTDEYARILMEQGDGARIYFWLNNELHGMPKEEHYVLTDMQHTPLRVMDREGDTRNIYRYSEFGTLEDAAEEIPLPFGFTGYYRENGKDLYFANAREYDSGKGSFLSGDAYRYIEYENPNTMNLYQYVQGNPLRYVDYSGHECIEENDSFNNVNNIMFEGAVNIGNSFLESMGGITHKLSGVNLTQYNGLSVKDLIIASYEVTLFGAAGVATVIKQNPDIINDIKAEIPGFIPHYVDNDIVMFVYSWMNDVEETVVSPLPILEIKNIWNINYNEKK